MRVVGITIPDEKRLEFALTAIYGIGRSRALSICGKANIDPFKKTAELTNEEEREIRRIIETLKVEGELRREVAGNIKRLKDIKAYRGVRHAKRLPSRGQRTKTNSRTVRGNVRKTMTSGRRKVEKT
ncbi:30S ribosomal protein S13 [Candidatus Kaiserbacteria bacterium RIFCSPHIGHO2_01_FULL_49_13]|uniref:Small ribosomal subunit protein uS13 n=1 Tax=Candidatus Kaiserbacteria bacterium RIFCSPHIGHO2_01_FULL_49_13 TaxID=1798477 RepID=A0A1F6CCL0_9BACT|nr:MAG: 30S ribosomal protein S13 [Candidatus Kaiserbacteria bacterium RIFCSPHIGHO2_01_FULL_49_13]